MPRADARRTDPPVESPSVLFRVDTADPTPVHVQLARRVRMAVAEGALQPGDPLPSVRGLARALDVSANTVGRAYTELSREGILVGRAGGGTVVAPRERLDYTALARKRQERLETLARQTAVRSLALGLGPDEVMEAVRRELARLGAPPRSAAEAPFRLQSDEEGPLLSARNRLPGRVEQVRLGDQVGEVTVVLPGESRLVVVVTRASVERLGLHAGKAVNVLLKATEPMLSA